MSTAMRIFFLLLVLPLARAGAAEADSDDSDWPASFPAARVGGYLDRARQRVVVIGAGATDAGDATAALIAALRESRRAALVMDQSAIGQVANLDDPAIVARAAALPVDAIAIVRVFPGGAGARDNAVVTLYDRQGQTRSAFTAEEGVAVAARSDGPGVAPRAAGAVSNVLRDSDQTSARREYDRTAVGFEDWTGINQYGAVVARWSVPVQGVQRKPLPGAKFYDVLGRHDLAGAYRTKRNIRIVLGVVGGALFLGGIGAMSWGLASIQLSPHPDTLNGVQYEYATNNGNTPWILTGVLLSVGITAMMTAMWFNPNPVPAEEARQMAIDFNRDLRKRLGLPEPSESRRTPSTIRNFALGPSVNPRGAGAQLGFSF